MKRFIYTLLVSTFVLSSCTTLSHKKFVEKDSRNENVPVVVKGFPFSKDITIDMQKTDNYGFSAVDMFRCYCQAAEMLREKDYDRVFLANKGEKVFFLTGTYFKDLGVSFAAGENPIYLMNHMPENVYNIDGTPAYGTWTGGWLGVASKQLEDFSDMMEKLVP